MVGTSHFLHIQIFQMESSTLPIILFASKHLDEKWKRGPVELGANLAEKKKKKKKKVKEKS